MAVNIFDELHSATTEGIVADDKQIRHGSNSTVSAELEKKQVVREELIPIYDKSVDGYVVEITQATNPSVVEWRGKIENLYITVSNCQNEVIVYFDGSSSLYDDAEKRLGDEVEIESDKTYVASYLDGIVAICEIQSVE